MYEKNSRVGGIAKERETGDKKRKERRGKRGEKKGVPEQFEYRDSKTN